LSLTVLSVAHPFAAVGPDAVGGAEQVLNHIDGALVAAGHRSIVVARTESRPSGLLVATDAPAGSITDLQRQLTWAEHRRQVARVLATHAVDVVHIHGIDFHAYLPPPGAVPVLVTLHLPPSWYASQVFEPARPDVYLHCVSHSQHGACPRGARLLPPIENGVPVRALESRCGKRRFALSLGRICPEKNVHVALDAGRLARIGVLVAGQVFAYEAHERYFREQLAPRLDSQRRFIGPVGFKRKRRLLTSARCLLLPTIAPETSSLAAMEALACGTPVIAFPSGALAEIVDHGVTGFLVRSAAEMADAIEACDAIDAERCRAVARERFALERMVGKYFDVYEQLRAVARPAPWRDAGAPAWA
jgi:glycosyltransferase involved in cell wall biosynthesis